MTCGSSITPTDAATRSPKLRVMHRPGTLTSRSHTRGGPSGSSPHMKLAMRPCVCVVCCWFQTKLCVCHMHDSSMRTRGFDRPDMKTHPCPYNCMPCSTEHQHHHRQHHRRTQQQRQQPTQHAMCGRTTMFDSTTTLLRLLTPAATTRPASRGSMGVWSTLSATADTPPRTPTLPVSGGGKETQ